MFYFTLCLSIKKKLTTFFKSCQRLVKTYTVVISEAIASVNDVLQKKAIFADIIENRQNVPKILYTYSYLRVCISDKLENITLGTKYFLTNFNNF